MAGNFSDLFVMLSMKAVLQLILFFQEDSLIPEELWSPGAILRWSCLLVQFKSALRSSPLGDLRPDLFQMKLNCKEALGG